MSGHRILIIGIIIAFLFWFPILAENVVTGNETGMWGNDSPTSVTNSISIQNNSSLNSNSSGNYTSGSVSLSNLTIQEISNQTIYQSPDVNQWGNSNNIQNMTNSSEPVAGYQSGAEDQPIDTDSRIQSGQFENIQAIDGTFTIISVGTDAYDEYYPSIWGNTIIWLDNRNWEQAIYLYDLDTGIEKMVTNRSPWVPAIYGPFILYTSNNNEYGTYDLYCYNILTGKEFAISPSNDLYNQNHPSIFNDRVVFMDDSKGIQNIVLFNITTNTSTFLTNNASGPDHLYPAIYDDWVVWYVGTDDNASLTLFNIATGSSTPIESTCKDIAETPPGIYQDRVVWQDWRDQEFDIYLYNITTRQLTLITPDTTDSDQKHPDIQGNSIVWDDNRGQSYGNENIYLFNLETNITSLVTGTFPDSTRIRPKIFGNRMVWAENRNNIDYNIAMFTIGPGQTPVSSDFTVNSTQGMEPVTVHFIDQSSGNPSFYHWDFGDGNESSEASPVYTYTQAGHFSPSLTVSSLWSRDYRIKENLITVGVVPQTKFSVNSSSGTAPLTVKFTDLSSGYPTSWDWDFGDNSTSDEQNPSYTYEIPGDYMVSLTTRNSFGNSTSVGTIHVFSSSVNESVYCIPGLNQYSSDTGFVEIDPLNQSSYSFVLGMNDSQLSITPKANGSMPSFVLISKENTSFVLSNSTLIGNIKKITITSEDISSPEFCDNVNKNSYFNYSFDMPQYNPDGSIKTIVSLEITPEEHEQFNISVQHAGYGDYVYGIGYSIQCIKNNISVIGPANITLSVGHDWVVKNSGVIMPHDRFLIGSDDGNGNFIPYTTQWKFSDPANHLDYYAVTNATAFNLSNLYILRYNESLSLPDSRMKIIDPADPGIMFTNSATIAVDSDWVEWNTPGIWNSMYDPVVILHIDDYGNFEVLNTTHLYYDSDKNLDVFRAYSPQGLSDFTLGAVGKYSNPFQLLYLSVLSRVSPAQTPAMKTNTAPVVGGGGGGGGGSYGGSGNTVTPSSPVEPASPGVTTASSPNLAEPQQTHEIASSPVQENSVQQQQPARPSGPVVTNNVLPSKTQPGVNFGGIFVQIPNSSVFSVFIEAAAMISVVLIVVFSMFTRYRRKEKD